MKKSDLLKELRGSSVADLTEKARSMGEELMKLRFQNAAGQYGQAHQFKALRKGIARIKTLVHEMSVKKAA